MAQAVEADLILVNGNIWRGRAEGHCQALAIWQGKVLAAGTDAEMLELKGAQTQVIDLDGRFASPGLNDNHLHLISTGLVMGWVDITAEAAPTAAALLESVARRATSTPKGDWIRARGYDQIKLDTGQHPTREELDQAAPDHPVMVTRACGHISVVNSKALELAGVGEDAIAPDGGVIGRTDGRLNGFLAENAQHLITDVIPPPSVEQLIEGIERAGRHLLSFGITSCMDAAVGQLSGFSEIRAYETAKLTGRLPVRVWLTLLADPDTSIIEDCWKAGLVTGAGDETLRIGGAKIFLDGSAGGRTAWMTRPYKDEPDNIGVQMLLDAQVEAMVLDLHQRGYRMACHAIGDAAINQLVTAYEKALAAQPDPDRRHRVEHCGYVDPQLNARMKAAGICPSPQLAFIHDFGDSYVAVLGPERGMYSYPAGTWQRDGFVLSTGSDSPVCSPNPFPNFHTMVTRQTWKGTVMGADESLSREDALQAYTEGGAYLEKAESTKGRLVPGQWADVAIFNNDLLKASVDVILNDTHCVLTLLGGKIVHDAR